MKLYHDNGAPRIWFGLGYYVGIIVLGFVPMQMIAGDLILLLYGDVDAGSWFGLGLRLGGPALAVLVVLAFFATASWCRGEPGRWKVQLTGLALVAGSVVLVALLHFVRLWWALERAS